MRTFSRTSQFKKDVKRVEKRGKDLAKLKAALELLIDGEPLPPAFKDHPLRGNFAGSWDCHIEPDWVLIYTLTENDGHVRFERTGTHSDLFRWPVGCFPFPAVASKHIKRTFYTQPRRLHDMGVNLGGCHIYMPQQRLHGADVHPGFEHVRGKGMAQCMTRSRLGDSRAPQRLLHRALHTRFAAQFTRMPPVRRSASPRSAVCKLVCFPVFVSSG